MTAEHQAQSGDWVWLPDNVECFIPARVETRGYGGSKASLRTSDGRVVDVAENKLATYATLQWSSLQRIVPDLTLLDDMNPAMILHNLKQRFEKDQVAWQQCDPRPVSTDRWRCRSIRTSGRS